MSKFEQQTRKLRNRVGIILVTAVAIAAAIWTGWWNYGLVGFFLGLGSGFFYFATGFDPVSKVDDELSSNYLFPEMFEPFLRCRERN